MFRSIWGRNTKQLCLRNPDQMCPVLHKLEFRAECLEPEMESRSRHWIQQATEAQLQPLRLSSSCQPVRRYAILAIATSPSGGYEMSVYFGSVPTPTRCHVSGNPSSQCRRIAISPCLSKTDKQVCSEHPVRQNCKHKRRFSPLPLQTCQTSCLEADCSTLSLYSPSQI